jgi:cytochrome c-type biogenesis protein CcmH
MQRLRNSLFVFLVAVAALAQTASEKPNVDVRRVGARLQCQCGCKDSVATCSMLECHFSKPAKERIAQMQSVGMNDEQIVQAFIRDYGMAIYLAPPNAFGWIIPYSVAGLGFVIVFVLIRKYYKPKPMTDLGEIEADDPELAKYKEQIEKDTANLD